MTFNPFADKPDAAKILKIKSVTLPEVLFEYHPASKKVYVVIFDKPLDQLEPSAFPLVEGQLIAEGVESAENAGWIARAFVGGCIYANRKTAKRPEALPS